MTAEHARNLLQAVEARDRTLLNLRNACGMERPDDEKVAAAGASFADAERSLAQLCSTIPVDVTAPNLDTQPVGSQVGPGSGPQPGATPDTPAVGGPGVPSPEDRPAVGGK